MKRMLATILTGAQEKRESMGLLCHDRPKPAFPFTDGFKASAYTGTVDAAYQNVDFIRKCKANTALIIWSGYRGSLYSFHAMLHNLQNPVLITTKSPVIKVGWTSHLKK